MFQNALAIDQSVIMYIVIGVVLVLMIVLTIIPQRKRKKQQEQMMNSLVVGTKIMTIGRMVGKITQVNADNTLIVNVGTENSPTLIVIDKNAVGLVLENAAQPVQTVQQTPAQEEVKAEEPVVASDPVISDPVVNDVDVSDAADNFEDIAPIEEPVEENAPAKPKKNKKK